MQRLENELTQTAPMTPPVHHHHHHHPPPSQPHQQQQQQPYQHHADATMATPVSASKFIERSLHDLDDLINQRRQELSELKRTNRQRLEATPSAATATTAAAPPPSRGGNANALELSPAVVSLSRAAYEELKENERALQNKLKAEQLRSTQLEDALADMENQCAAHAERAKAAVADRNRSRPCACRGGTRVVLLCV